MKPVGVRNVMVILTLVTFSVSMWGVAPLQTSLTGNNSKPTVTSQRSLSSQSDREDLLLADRPCCLGPKTLLISESCPG